MKLDGYLKVLIVDDLNLMREEFIATCLQFIPRARIDEATDAMKALDLLQNEVPAYDAIFTDLNMPLVSGLKLIAHVRKLPNYKKTPLIVISTLSGHPDIERAIELGASGYLTRPLQKDEFEIVYVAYLKPLLDRKRKGNSGDLDPDALIKSLRK